MKSMIPIENIVVPTKQEQSDIVSQVRNSIQEGEADPIKIWLYAKALEKIIEGILEDEVIEDKARMAFGQYRNEMKSDFTIHGAKVEIVPTKKYDYEKASVRWSELQKQIDPLREKQKDLEKRLKSLNYGNSILDEATGEIIGECPIIKEGETIKVTFGK
jgi:uncharacterized protein YpuA (DUF1002 family)